MPSVYRWVPSTNWSTAVEVVTHEKLKWAIYSMAPYKSPGVDEIYPVLFNGGLRTSVHPWYISLELLLPWDIFLVYGDLPGLTSFPNRESLIMLLLKHSDQLASPPSC